jgi:hypothetical protein
VGTGTVVVLYSVNTPDYPSADWIINPDLSALTGVQRKWWKIVGDDVLEMEQAEKDLLAAAELPSVKEAKAAAIDGRTRELLEKGVEFPASSGNFYSLTSDRLEQFKLMVEAASYPFDWDSTDNLAKITIGDAGQATSLLASAANKVSDIQNSGTALKQQVRDCASAACVDAIVDPR